MIAKIGEKVLHLPTRRTGEVIYPPAWINVNRTFVRFANGSVEEIPDEELKPDEKRTSTP